MRQPVLIPRATLVDSPWSNGAGRKADIAGGPGWQVGFASLERDAPFSDFTGQDRTITLVEGPGFTLEFPGASLALDSLHQPGQFDGGTNTFCRVRGPCTVLNAMTRRDRFHHSVTIADAGPLTADDEQMVFAVVLSGTLELADGGTADRFDSLQITGPTDCAGNARLAVIRITPI